MEMHVVKRDGRKQPVKFDKITARIKKLAYGLDPMVDIIEVAQKVVGFSIVHSNIEYGYINIYTCVYIHIYI